MFKDLFKALNVGNAKSKLLKDALNAREYGIAHDNVKWVIGLHIKQNVMRDRNSYNKCNRRQKIIKKFKSQLHPNQP